MIYWRMLHVDPMDPTGVIAVVMKKMRRYLRFVSRGRFTDFMMLSELKMNAPKGKQS